MTTPSRSTAEAALVGLSPEAADDARAALDWLLPEGDDLADLSQLDLQLFLWYSLPMKWLTEESHHHEVARALGDALSSAGLDRYAGLCRSPETHQLIRRWTSDPEEARKELRRMLAVSGVDPTDTPLVQWGSVQGVVENAVSRRVSQALEAAIDDGRLVPGSRGWKVIATHLIDQTLMTCAPGEQRSLLQEVEAERLTGWLDDRRRSGLQIGESLRIELQDPVPRVTEHRRDELAFVGSTLEPLRWLLHEVGDGVTMTQAGYLPRALVLAADERYDWFEMKPRFTVRTERDLHQLHTLARQERLVTLRRHSLSLSARGRSLVEDPAGLAEVVLRAFVDRRTWEGDTGLAMATLLAQWPQDRTLQTDDLAQSVETYLGTHWRVDGAPVSGHAVRAPVRDALRLAGVFGWTTPRPRQAWSEAPTLSNAGHRAVRAALRLTSVEPRDRP